MCSFSYLEPVWAQQYNLPGERRKSAGKRGEEREAEKKKIENQRWIDV